MFTCNDPLRKRGQEDCCEFRARLGYRVRPCLKEKEDGKVLSRYFLQGMGREGLHRLTCPSHNLL